MQLFSNFTIEVPGTNNKSILNIHWAKSSSPTAVNFIVRLH